MALVVANIALKLVNSSFEHSLLDTLRYPNALLRSILAATAAMLLLLRYMPLFRDFFHLASPGIGLLAPATGVGLASVLWYEGVKGWKRRNGCRSTFRTV